MKNHACKYFLRWSSDQHNLLIGFKYRTSLFATISKQFIKILIYNIPQIICCLLPQFVYSFLLWLQHFYWDQACFNLRPFNYHINIFRKFRFLFLLIKTNIIIFQISDFTLTPLTWVKFLINKSKISKEKYSQSFSNKFNINLKI